MKLSRLIFALALGLLLAAPARDAEAYPLNPWGGITGKGAVSITPFLYAYSGPSFYPYLYASYGVSEKFDVFVGASAALELGEGGGGFGFGSAEIFPRFFVIPELALVPHFFFSSGTIIPSPEVHFVKGWDNFSLTINAGWKPVISGGAFSSGTVGALIAPEIYLSKQFSLFLEVDPIYDLTGGGFGLTVVPGVGFALEEDQVNLFAVGLQIAVPTDGSGFSAANNLSAGIWYSRAFGGGGDE